MIILLLEIICKHEAETQSDVKRNEACNSNNLLVK